MTVRLNPNLEERAEAQAALRANDGYCPCSLIKDERHKCMCCDFREQTEEGFCHCGLYQKVAG